MVQINPRLVFLLAMIAGVGYVLWRDRDKVQRQSILFYRRTQHGVDFIDRVAKRFPRFWNFYGWAAVVLGLLSIPLVAYQLGRSIFRMAATRSTEGGPALIAPGLGSSATFQSGISFIPVEYWVASIGVLMVVHEFSHGIVARAQDFEINSVGWVIFGIIPGAFVEPKGENMLPGGESDEARDSEITGGLWDQGSWTSRMKVLAAGSFANYLTALLFVLAALFVFTTVSQSAGVTYIAEQGMPAAKAGMDNGTLYAVDGERVRYASEVSAIGNNLSVGEKVRLWTSEGNFTVETISVNGSESGYIGILMFRESGIRAALVSMVTNSHVIKPAFSEYSGFLGWFISGLEMIALLNFVVGFFNMLPVKPLDGGQILDTLAERFAPSIRGAINYWSLLVWIVLLGTLVLSIIGI
ncbi:MAG: site-2 protease family protein [Candidatus Nanohaloarchaea archaeon]